MVTLLRILLLLCLLAPGWARAGDLVVVAAARGGIDRLSRDEVINIYMGRYRVLPNGVSARPIDHPGGAERALFYRKLVGKELPDINAYWARLVFSGKTTPPAVPNRASEVADWVASREGAIGYLERDRLDSRLKVVLELP